MTNPNNTWERVVRLYGDPDEVEVVRAHRIWEAWQGAKTDVLIPKLHEEMQIASAFYEKFDYGWILDCANYEFPQDIFYQYCTMTAVVGAWYCAEEKRLSDTLFADISARTLFEWGLKDGAPRARPPASNWKFTVFPYAWFEFTTTAMEAYLSTCEGPVEIDQINLKSNLEIVDGAAYYWDALLIKSVLDDATCHDVLKPGLADKISKQCGAPTFLQPVNSPMRPADVLSEFVLRFAAAHEVGHHLSAVFDPESLIHPEVLADFIALSAMRSKKWESMGETYAPLLKEPRHVPVLAGYLFSFILSLWVTARNSVGRVAGESETVRRKRQDTHSLRLNSWLTTVKKREFAVSCELEIFFESLNEHDQAFTQYAQKRSREIYALCMELNAKERFEAPSAQIISAWVRSKFGQDAPLTVAEARAKIVEQSRASE